MENVGNGSYSPVNEEKGDIPPWTEQSNGLCMALMRLLDSCCLPISTNTGMKGRWIKHTGDLEYVTLYHKEHISNKDAHRLLL